MLTFGMVSLWLLFVTIISIANLVITIIVLTRLRGQSPTPSAYLPQQQIPQQWNSPYAPGPPSRYPYAPVEQTPPPTWEHRRCGGADAVD